MEKTTRKGFTLIEVTVGIAIFALVITACGQTMFFIKQDSLRQKASMDLLRNARWAMEFMTNEIRMGESFVVSNGNLNFNTPYDNNIWYWRGDGAGLGSNNILYRGTGVTIALANNNRQEIAEFIVDNPDIVNNASGQLSPDGIADPIFINQAGVIYIELNFRPRPNVTESPGNREYTVMTQVRPRGV